MVVWQFMFDVFGDFELSVECVLSWEKYLLHCGSSRGFGTEGMLGSIIWLYLLILPWNLCPVSDSEPCWSNSFNRCGGFCCWVWVAISHETTYWLLKRKSRWMVDPLWSIELEQCTLGVCKDLEEKEIFET